MSSSGRNPGSRLPPAGGGHDEIYAPLASAGGREHERYSEAELALLRDFLRRGRELQEEHIERVRARLRARQDGDAAS